MGKKQVPAIRFQGFTDAWEQRKLGDIADIVGGGTPSTGNPSYWDGDIDWYAPAEIADQIYANSSQKKITDLGYANSSAKMLPPGTVLFTSRAGIGKTAILTRKGCTNQGFQSIVPHRGELDTYFIFSRTEELKRYGELVGAGSTFVEVSGKQMAVMELMMPPTMREQQTIGGFFQQLDHLITLHQRKYEKLLKVKKSMLEKMFPRDGADVPEIRFDGFTDAWEQRKLGDIYIERNERGNAELDILSVSIHHGISQNELDTDELGKSVRRSDDKSLYKHVYYGDLVFNMMRAWQGAIGVVKNEGMVSPAYISAIPDDSVFPEFMDYCLRRKCIINQINNLSYGVTDFRKRLYWEPFTRVTIMMPSVDEQRKITDIFRQLDDLITLHQRKLEKLKNIKKSLLEKMFV